VRHQTLKRCYLLAGLAFLAGWLIACSGSGPDEPGAVTPEPTVPVEATGEAVEEVLEGEDTVTLKLMSFNLLHGAGVDRRFDMNIPQRFWRDRMPQLLTFIREVNPDILAVQEASAWESGSPSVADQIAAMLGMTYVIARDPWELHVLIFSRFPIVESEYVSRTQGFNGVLLRTKLAVTPAAEINVIGVHFNSMSSQTRACQVEALLDITSRLGPGRTFIAGDMNFRPASAQAQLLISRDWQLVVAEQRWPVDQIWADPDAVVSNSDWWSGFTPPPDISDHSPIGAEVTFITPRVRTRATNGQPAEPKALNYACNLPS
jgi:endonuclease/exonuclease/phosphatase family metal-dependent hydrolase